MNLMFLFAWLAFGFLAVGAYLSFPHSKDDLFIDCFFLCLAGMWVIGIYDMFIKKGEEEKLWKK